MLGLQILAVLLGLRIQAVLLGIQIQAVLLGILLQPVMLGLQIQRATPSGVVVRVITIASLGVQVYRLGYQVISPRVRGVLLGGNGCVARGIRVCR